MLEALAGVAVAVVTIAVARAIRGERWLYAIGLLSLPSLYASFALHAGEPAVGVKEMLVAEAGGRCVTCGFDSYVGALQFHHRDPTTKSFEVSQVAIRGVARDRR